MRKKMLQFWTIAALFAALTASCAKAGGGQVSESSSIPDAASGALSEADPLAGPVSFEGSDLEGNSVSASVFSQSKLTMINVWATYCNPCLREMPALGELAAEYDGEELQIIGIVSDVLEGEDPSAAEDLIRQTGANYPHLLLNESIYYGLLSGVSAVPTTFFLDQDGNLLDTVVGAMEKAAWEEKIDGLLETL